MKQRCLSVLVMLCMLLTILPATANAAEKVAGGYCGYSLIWELDDTGTLTIEGTGKMADYSRDNPARWYDYRDRIRQVVLPSGITRLGDFAFADCTLLTTVEIPEGVKDFGKYVFSGCTGLTSITIPQGTKTIPEGMFSGCSSLTSMVIPDGVTAIGHSGFALCSGLTSVTIPESMENIYDFAFWGCEGLTSLDLPEKMKIIGGGAFSGCSGLVSMELPEGLTSVAGFLFQRCSSLTSVTLPQNIYSIGIWAFEDCPSLTSVVIPEGTVELDDAVFRNCSSLTSIVLPDSIVRMGQSVFSGCSSLESVTLSGSITDLPYDTFEDCSSLTSITIPESVTSISSAFVRCTALRKIVFEGDPPNFATGFSYETAVAYYPAGNEKWTEEVMGSTHANLTWVSYDNPEDTDHSPVYEAPVAATCTEDGLTVGWHCADCGGVIVAREVEQATGHTPDKEATCLAPQTCQICHEILVPAKAHTEKVSKGRAPTCTQWGWTDSLYCSACQMGITQPEYIPPTGHTPGAEATCTEEQTCTTCGEVLAATRAHTEVIDEAKAPTCTETGLTQGSHCADCSTVLTEQEIVEAKGHSFGEWETVKEPTEDMEGEARRKCENCEETESKPLPKVSSLMLGDVNGDGKINPKDAAMVLQRFVGKPVNGFNAAAADVNGDGKINPKDAAMILQRFVGKLDEHYKPIA